VETTNRIFSAFAAAKTRAAMLAAMFVAAIGMATPALAALQSVTVGPQTGALTAGTAGSATFVVTVTRTFGTPATPASTITTAWPAGVTAVLGTPSAWSPATGTGSRTQLLTVSTSSAAVATTGTSFTFRAGGVGGPTGNGTLVIQAAGPAVAPTITFGTAPTPTYLGGNFTVSATTNSNGTLTYSRVSGPCAQVSGASFSSSGAGVCVVQASTAATTSYLAGSAQQSVTIAKANQALTFNPLANKSVGDAAFNPGATASSGLAPSYSVSSTPAAGVCSVAGSTVSIVGVGTCTVTAAQAGDANFNAAVSVAQSFAITAFAGTELYAVAGSAPPASLPGQAAAVPVWGYSLSNAAVTAPGGPTLVYTQGDSVTIRLHNQLAEATGLLFQGQAMVPDTTGVVAGGTRTYSFTASRPGTYLYEAGLLPGAQHQPAMGLYGVLIVRPAAVGQAYDPAATAFNDEAVMLLSELDPALNTSATPAAFDMRNYAPKYFMINGKVYPGTAPIASVAGNKVLLRYVNAGAKHHSMAVLGLRQNFVAKDAGLLPTLTHNVAAETLAPGQTADAIATVPATAAAGSRFAVYDGNLMLHNNGAAGFGGMLTFVTTGGTAGGDTVGPTVTSAVTLTPTTVSATVSDAATGGANVTAAEFFVDTTGTNGSGTAMTGAFGTVTVNVSGTMATLTGSHTVYVHGRDALGNWGAFRSAVINNDTTGPTTSGLTLTPNPSNGSVSVALHATGSDVATGGSNITQAEYFVGATGANGSGTAMSVNAVSPTASLDATIAAPVTGGVVSVHSRDDKGNWGPFATITLSVIGTGPVVSNVGATPNPNNGTVPLSTSQAVVRVTATLTGGGTTTVSGAEGFIDTVGAVGTGFPFVASDGVWNTNVEAGYVDIPLVNINALTNGNHTLYVRGRDSAGNWGATGTVVLVIDRTAPTVGVTAANGTVAAGGTVTLTVAANDTGGAGVSLRQYWVDGSATPPANPIAFTGATLNITGLTGGTHTVYVRVQDAAGNWSTVSSVTVYVVQAVNDTVPAFNANNNASQQVNIAAPGVLANDAPDATVAGRTATLVSGPIRTSNGSGTGTGTIAVTCPNASATAICANGSYRITLTGVGATGAQRAASKRGTYQFTYRETLNGVNSAPATVTITVN
jgi:hypothetical protein